MKTNWNRYYCNDVRFNNNFP